MIDISNSKLFEILPASIRNDEDIRAAAIAVDRSTGDIYSFSRKLDFRSNKDVKDHEILDELAIDLHVDFYDKNLHADMKREIIDDSIIQHMEKGTGGAVERALANIGVKGEVVEWYQYEGTPFTFRIILSSPVDLTNSDIKRIINSYKNTRSHFEHFEVQVLQVIGIMRVLNYTFPVPYKITGTFHTAPTNGIASKSTVSAKSKTYANPVPYPITGTFYCSEGGH